MENIIQKFRESSIGFENPGILSEDLKMLMSCNNLVVQYFLLKRHSVYKRVCGIFLLFRS